MAPGEKSKKNPCLHCRTNVGQEKSVKCTMCDQWTHTKCAQIDDDLYKNLLAISEKGFKHCWTCNCCTISSENLNKKVLALEKMITAVDKKVDKNKEEIDTVNTRVDTLTDMVKEVKENAKSDKLLSTTQDNVFKEIQERENRKENIVIHGMPEPKATVTNALDRKDKDSEQITNILKDIDIIIDMKADVKFMIRTGEKKDNVDYVEKPRPLIIGLRDLKKREDILNSARKLATTNHDKISIIPDLTKRQREEEETMRTDMKKRNEDMKDDEALNFIWKVVGRRGQRKLVKLRRRDQDKSTNQDPRPRKR